MRRIFGALGVFLLVSCSHSGSGFGTSESGGGNGIDGKPIDYYIIQPDQLPAYKQIIQPKIDQLAQLSPAPSTFTSLFKKWLLYKTWYLAPIKLDTLPNSLIGVPPSDAPTQQLAGQTDKDVWIDSDLFNTMTVDAQAALIVHEMVMSLYFLKYKSWTDICNEGLYIDNDCGSAQDTLLDNQIFPSTDPQPLSSSDYDNIRPVVQAMLSDFSFKSSDDVDQLLISHSFDRRFTYRMGLDQATGQEQFIYNSGEKLTTKDLSQMINNLVLLNHMPDLCHSISFKKDFVCTFSNKWPLFNIAASELNFSGLISGDLTGSSIQLVDENIKISHFNLAPPTPTPATVGTTFRSLTLVVYEDLNAVTPTPILLGLFSAPGVVTSIDPQIPQGCDFTSPSPTSPANDWLLIYSHNLTDFQKGLVNMEAVEWPVATSCR